MKKIEIYCDRCKELIPFNKIKNTHGYKIIAGKNHWETLDLCQRCYDSLDIWIHALKDNWCMEEKDED